MAPLAAMDNLGSLKLASALVAGETRPDNFHNLALVFLVLLLCIVKVAYAGLALRAYKGTIPMIEFTLVSDEST